MLNPSMVVTDLPFTSQSVSWQDVQVFIEKLNALDKNHTYRLPTEFEWEYAARAGADDDIAWDEIRISAVIGTTSTSEVGTKKPNAWGLFDMHGNVMEWVSDWYDSQHYQEASAKNDPGPLTARDPEYQQKVVRGGAWGGLFGKGESAQLRSAKRWGIVPWTQAFYLGFRCARDVK